MDDVLEISYRVSGTRLLLLLVATGLGAGILIYFATTNDRGLILNGIITLSRGQATLFYWVMAGVNGWLAVMALVSLTGGVASRDHIIRLTAGELTAPKGFFLRRPVTLPLHAISKMRVHSANGTRYLNLKTTRGRLNVSRREIGAAAFEALQSALDDRLRGAYR